MELGISALNAAIREGLPRDSPARYVEVPSPRRPYALVWTAQRVEPWRTTGERPSVAVWTTEQTAYAAEAGARRRGLQSRPPTPPK